MRTPPSLLSLTIDSAVLHLFQISDLSPLPVHIFLDLFLVRPNPLSPLLPLIIMLGYRNCFDSVIPCFDFPFGGFVRMWVFLYFSSCFFCSLALVPTKMPIRGLPFSDRYIYKTTHNTGGLVSSECKLQQHKLTGNN